MGVYQSRSRAAYWDGTILLWQLIPTTPLTPQITEGVNGDGVVNIQDLVQVAGQLGAAPAAPAAWIRDREIAPTRADVEQWLAEAQQLNLTDVTSQRGIGFLESLLVLLTPQETALLPNYPNPFNPELTAGDFAATAKMLIAK